jgi:hypothetical protein
VRTRPQLEVADILRTYGPAYQEAFGAVLSPAQRRVLHDLVRCRTAALGGHVEVCDQCGHQRIAYNSCRNRHCPKCQGAARARWLDDRAAALLPTDYFHVVFTLPQEIGPLALQNPGVVYGTLFRATAESLLQVAADPQYLGAEIGCLAVLHTWGQNLHLHPHVHCVVPGGGLAFDGQRWVACRPGFLLPVKVLGQVFRDQFVARLQDSFARGRLAFHGQQAPLAEAARFGELLESVRAKDWVVYAQPPVGGGPEPVLKYLARYTYRVAIANQRLVKIEDDQVYFKWKDYAHGNVEKTMALDAFEFIRRFLLHVLPSGFVRIRQYGLLANRHREEKLKVCRQLLGVSAQHPVATTRAPEVAPTPTPEAKPVVRCPVCHQGRLVILEAIEPQWSPTGKDTGNSQQFAADTS